ncbi:hypothetical protein ACJOV8_014485 [Formosa sp. 3Alg 14/1]|uniref:hypothetical protein n=1 Tax=Formosa sp. 3Alg 14/1 TaxID=3382190 RepID=UPI0039BDC2CF
MGENSQRIDSLEHEKAMLWERLVELENKITIRPSDYERDAKQASRKAAEYRNKTEERFNQANSLYESIETLKGEVLLQSEVIFSSKDDIVELLETSTLTSADIKNLSSMLLNKCNKLSEIFEKYPDLKTDIDDLTIQLNSIEESSNKANSTYKGILSKKTEIDSLHREIVGYTDKDEDGEEVIIDGLKTELEKSYDNLHDNSIALNSKINEIENESYNKVKAFIDNNKEELQKVLEHSSIEYESINKRIEELLPNAMTAGLSFAFVKKKKEEEELFKEYKEKFSKGIRNLALVSILPILISVYSLLTGVELSEVINRTPKVILAFMPLYIPLIWTTISANKKVNLSKRLIEEYSHKQVLSMTIQGLSNQIDDLDNDNIAQELRTQLLGSFLKVSSENPGKLISDYQKSDNPILNLLDRDRKVKKSKTIAETVEEKASELVEDAVDTLTDKAKKNISL